MLRRYLAPLVIFTLLLQITGNANAQSTLKDEPSFALQVAWGESRSRWELRRGLRKIRPDSWRLSVIKPKLTTFDVFTIPLQLDLDVSVYHWNDPWRRRNISVASVVPMFRHYWQVNNLEIFAGLGIGIAALDSDKWMDRQLGSQLQFEDKFEVGLRFQNHQLSFNLSHFSNADLADINHGVNVYQLGYAVYF